jgi:Protein of unknown function (DUF3795)
MTGYCGLDCDRCEAFIATQKNDDTLRAKVAAEWAKSYNAPIGPEHINCTGCKSAGVKTYYCEQLCEVRKCATTRSISTCAECSAYPCSVLGHLLDAAPQAKATLEALRKRLRSA